MITWYQNLALHQNYPNPFNPTTEIKYQVQLNIKVSIVIYNLKGERVRTLFDGYKSVGEHNIKWNGKNDLGGYVAAGQYFYQLKVGDFIATKKCYFLND